jgi:hypothetical protein
MSLRPPSPRNEKSIEKKVCEFAEKRGCYVRKFTSPARRGVPDRIFITPSGVVFFVEFKKRGGLTTELQNREIEKLRKVNVPVYVVDSVEVGEHVVQENLGFDDV